MLTLHLLLKKNCVNFLSYQKGVNKFRGLLLINSLNKTKWGCLFPSSDYASGRLSLFLRLISLFERYKITCGIFSCSFSKTAALVNSVLYTMRFILKKKRNTVESITGLRSNHSETIHITDTSCRYKQFYMHIYMQYQLLWT